MRGKTNVVWDGAATGYTSTPRSLDGLPAGGDYLHVTSNETIEGVDGMLRRARAYAEAGADLIFADAIRSEEQVKRLVDAARVPVTVNMGFGIRSRPTTPLMSLKRLAEIGVRRVTVPRMLPAAAIMGMTRALDTLKEVAATGVPVDRPDLAVGIEDIMRLMDYDNMRALERKLLSTEALEAKYGAAAE